MHLNRVGIAAFGPLEIWCLEIADNFTIVAIEFEIEGEHYSFDELCEYLYPDCPEVVEVLEALGREGLISAVLAWNPSDPRTRDAFYRYQAYRQNQDRDWD